MARRGQLRRDLARDGEDLAPFFERQIGRDQRSAPLASLDNDGHGRQPRDDPVPRREPPGCGLDTRRVLGHGEAG